MSFTRGWGRNIFVSFKPPRPGTEPRTLASKAAVLTTTLEPPPSAVGNPCTVCQSRAINIERWGHLVAADSTGSHVVIENLPMTLPGEPGHFHLWPGIG